MCWVSNLSKKRLWGNFLSIEGDVIVDDGLPIDKRDQVFRRDDL